MRDKVGTGLLSAMQVKVASVFSNTVAFEGILPVRITFEAASTIICYNPLQ